MKYAIALGCLAALCALLLSGCGSSKMRLELEPESRKITAIEIDNSFGNEGCAVAARRPDGSVALLVAQAGESNYITGRMLGYAVDVAGSMPIIGGGGPDARRMDEMQGPSSDTPCEGALDGFFAPLADEQPENVLKLPPGVSAEAKETLQDLADELGDGEPE